MTHPIEAPPFPPDLLRALAQEHGTPLFVYAADVIARRVRELAGFDVVRYAQKANSNLAVLAALRRLGCAVDAVSAGEIARALRAGYEPREIVYTADLFDRAALAAVARFPVDVNCGSPFMLEQLARVRPGARVTLRVNPGFGHGHDRKVNTGGEHSKHGIWHAELAEVVARARTLGLVVGGLHVHIGSGSDLENLDRVRGAILELAPRAGPALARVSIGGGLPVPYRPGEPRIDLERFTRAWKATKHALEERLGRALVLEVEPGRYLVAEAGVLVAEVRGEKSVAATRCVLVDAGFHNLVRPAMYGAFHRITALDRAAEPATPAIVAGPLCESADVFTQARGGELDPQLLPALAEGDLLCIHDAGAYGMSMASNYNSQPLAAEVLVEDGVPRLVRRRQRIEELFELESD
ncbi:MAG: diaminopimelate decarboxylase [Planctomycetes bacterium]|nr:diaminopimelate decarboxylase [Planctomycetota bacterium]